MANLKIYHNPDCSKSRATLQLIQERSLPVNIINYLENPPTAAEIYRICQGLSVRPTDIIRSTEDKFESLGLSIDDQLTDEEWCQIMFDNPVLIERPLVVNGDQVALGRPPEQVLEILGECQSVTTLTDIAKQESLDFAWGSIKWLCNSQIDSQSQMTFGIVHINPGESNPIHYHPNCEELIYVISGQCEHSLSSEVHQLKAGMMLRIPQGVKHNAINNGLEPVSMVICYSSADRQTVFIE